MKLPPALERKLLSTPGATVNGVPVEGKARKRKRIKVARKLNGPRAFMQVWLDDLPMPPSANDHWMPRKGGGYYLSKEAREFRRAVAAAAFGVGHVIGKIEAKIWVGPTDVDADNLVKEIFDAAQAAGVFANDKQVRTHHVYMDGRDKPGIGVRFTGEYPG